MGVVHPGSTHDGIHARSHAAWWIASAHKNGGSTAPKSMDWALSTRVLVETFNDAIGLWGIINIQVTNGSDILEVFGKFAIQELPPTIATQAGYSIRAAMDLHPGLIMFV